MEDYQNILSEPEEVVGYEAENDLSPHCRAGLAHHLSYYIIYYRPIFIISLFVIVLWREFICVKIPQGEANKSANRWGNLCAKGGVVPPSVVNLPSLCEHQIQLFTLLRLLLHLNSGDPGLQHAAWSSWIFFVQVLWLSWPFSSLYLPSSSSSCSRWTWRRPAAEDSHLSCCHLRPGRLHLLAMPCSWSVRPPAPGWETRVPRAA